MSAAGAGGNRCRLSRPRPGGSPPPGRGAFTGYRGLRSWWRLAGLLCGPQNPLAVRGRSHECSRQLGFLRGGVLDGRDAVSLRMNGLVLSPGASHGPPVANAR